MNIRLQSREEKEFIAIFKSYKHNVYGFACRMLNNEQIAEDITEESFLRLYQRLIDGFEIDKPRAWLMVTARNLCLNQIRDNCNKVPMETLDFLNSGSRQSDPDIRRLLNEAFARLDKGQREAFLLKEIEGFSYREIADILSTTTAGVRSLLYRARKELKKLISNKGNIRR